MQKRKVIALTISLMIILGLMAPAFAAVKEIAVEQTVSVSSEDEKVDMKEKEKEAKISKDKAIEIAKKKLKEYFGHEIDEKKFESRIEFREDYSNYGEYVWEIDWHKYDENTSINIDVSINANDGGIKRISKREYNDGQDKATIAQITRDEAKTIADEFLKRVNPAEYKEVKLDEKNYMYPNYRGNTSYNFTYTRQINGIPFSSNAITVEIDGVNAEVRGYSYNWDNDVQFENTEGIIDKEKAEQILRDNIDMNLRYISSRDNYDYYDEKVKEVKPVYNPKFENGRYLDAKEGTMIDRSGRNVEEERVKNITDGKKEEIFKKAKKVTKRDKEISQERANEIITKYINEIYGEGYEINQLRYIENDDYWETNGKKSWSARYEKSNSFRRHFGGKITIDALTEELISARSYNDIEDEIEEGYKPIITWEQGYDKAIEAIAKYFPDKIKDIDTEEKYRKHRHFRNGKEMPEFEYDFHFQRQVNGIYYSNDSISINLDTKEGKIRRINCRWNEDVEFPDIAGAIPKEDAKDTYFENYKPELSYTKINKSDDHKNPDWEIKLVYTLTSKQYRLNNIDAFTGKFLDYSGEEVSEEENKFKEKIKGHDAEKELNILASQGIIDTKKFELNKEITMDEAVKMLVDAKGYRPYRVRKADDLKFSNVTKADENYKYLQMAVKYGILENKEGKYKGDSKITREDLAEMMVKLLGHDEIAKVNSIFKVSYKDENDISKEKIGYVAICEGLKIMKDIDGKFEPKNNVKMVDMAIAIYNALGSIRKD